jgi:hypothetical protein
MPVRGEENVLMPATCCEMALNIVRTSNKALA